MTCGFQTSPTSFNLSQKWTRYNKNNLKSKIAIYETNTTARDLKILVTIDLIVL